MQLLDLCIICEWKNDPHHELYNAKQSTSTALSFPARSFFETVVPIRKD